MPEQNARNGLVVLTLPERPDPMPLERKMPKNFFATDIGYDVIEQALELKLGRDEAHREENQLQPRVNPSKFERLLLMMRDPERGIEGSVEQNDLSVLMRKAQVSYFDVFQLLTDFWSTLHAAKKAEARVRSASQHLGAFFDDVARDAISREVPCGDCQGGIVVLTDKDGATLDVACEHCKGKGVVMRQADSKSREQFIKIHGLDDAKAGSGGGGSTTVNVSAQAAAKADGAAQPKPVSVLTKVDSIINQ